MRVNEFAKKLSEEAGKTITTNQLILILSKKKDGIRLTSDLSEELMQYAKIRILGSDKKSEPTKKDKAFTKAPISKKNEKPEKAEKQEKKKSERSRYPKSYDNKNEKVKTIYKIKGTGTKSDASMDDKVPKPLSKTLSAESTKPAAPSAEKTNEKEQHIDILRNIPEGKEAKLVQESVIKNSENAAEEIKTEAGATTENTVASSDAKAAEAAETSAPNETEKASENKVSEINENENKESEKKEAENKETASEAADSETKKESEEPKSKEEAVESESAKVNAGKEETAVPAKETAAASEKPKNEKAPEKAKSVPADKNTKTNKSFDKSDRSDRSDRSDKQDRKPKTVKIVRPEASQNYKGSQKGDRDFRKDKPNQESGQRGRSDKKFEKSAPAMDIVEKTRKNERSSKKDKNNDRQNRFDREFEDGPKKKNKQKNNNAETFSRNDNRKNKDKKKPVQEQQPKQEETIKTIILPESLTVSELASKIKVPVNALIKKLFLEGKMLTVNTELSFEDAGEIALEYNIIAEQEEKVDIIEEALRDVEDPEDSLTPRPPVVCVMGHVDHGKTSLLDAIRKTSVTEGEAGGITQHIGAYTVKVNDQSITFLDTPGHEAFTAMRMRGAQSTDIAILVVAADDGVMPQTIEAINHAKAANIEIIVAINKIDKPSANIERVKQELTEYGLIAEDWGGSTVFCPVSAHTKEGIDNLLEMILITADVLELKANKNRKARGVVIEARLDKGRGPVATLLVQKGTLNVGDFVAIGEHHGKVRNMIDDKQRRVKTATPSTPVEITGLDGVPNSGDIFISTETEKEARHLSETFIIRGKENLIAETKHGMSLDDLFSKMQEGKLKELDIVIKADVQGSVEAVKQSLEKLSNEEIMVKCIHSGVGAVNESDVTLAAASSAIIIAFNTKVDPMAKSLADEEKVDLRQYRVIYNAIDDIESAMKGMLDPIYEEKIIGEVEIRQIYKASGIGNIAGSYVKSGVVERNASARIRRDGEVIFDGKLASLKRFKDDVKEVKEGFECGLVFDGFNDIAEEDMVEIYKMVEVPRK